MTEELDAIVFDVGETLLHMKPTRAELFAKVLSSHGFEADQSALEKAIGRTNRALDEEFANLEGGDESGFWKHFDDMVLHQIGFKGDLELIHRALVEEFDRVLPKVGTWVDYPETKEVLHGLRSRGFTLGVISNGSILVNKVLDNLELTKDFDFVIVSHEVGMTKPSRKIFSMAADRAGTSPNRMLYIGDRLSTDVKGAVGAGMNAILIDRADAYPDADCIRIKDLRFLKLFI